jgi:hypothetical protein
MNGIRWFAAGNDLLLVLDDLERRRAVRYALAGSFSSETIQQWTTGRQLPSLGKADGEQAALCSAFLITDVNMPIVGRRILQFDGRSRFAVDQLANPDSVVLTPAGEWRGEMLLAGGLGTAHKTAISKALMRLVSTSVKKHFTKARGYWLGPQALHQLRAGERLTIAEQSPREFDLTLDVRTVCRPKPTFFRKS